MRHLLRFATVVVVGLLPSASAQSPDSLAAPPDSAVVPLESLVQPYLREHGRFAGQEALFDWFWELEPRQRAAGSSPHRRPRDEGALWVLGADSTVWVQPAQGDPFHTGAYLLWSLGRAGAGRLGYADMYTEGVGYGYESGRLYPDVTQSAPVVGVLVVLLLLLVGGGMGVYRLRKALEHSLEQERRLVTSRRRLVESREEERIRLARDLHDGPLQDIQALRMQLAVAERKRRGRSPSAPDREAADSLSAAVERVQGELLRVGAELREISEGLRPPVLGSFGLAPAVRVLVDRLRTSHPALAVHHHLESEGRDLPDPVRLAFYRVLQEAVNNAIEHGQAQQVRIEYALDGERRARLTVADDGAGFAVPADLHAFEREGHLGLAGMAERAEALGGTLRIESVPGRTTIEMSVPLGADPS